jgi:hypothetical protein
MGGVQSTSVATDIINRTITDQSTSFINTTNREENQNLNADQDLDFAIKIGGSMIGCDSNFKQQMKVTADVYSEISKNNSIDLQRKIEEALSNDAKSEIEQVLSGIPVGSAQLSDTKTSVENASFHDMSTTIANSLTANIKQAITAAQKQKIDIEIGGDYDCTSGGGIDVGQNIDLSAIIDSTLKEENVAKVINDFSKKVDNVISSSSSQILEGIDPFAIIGAIIGLVVIIVIAVIVATVLKKK